MIDHEYDGDRVERLHLVRGSAQFERIAPDVAVINLFDEEEDRYSSIRISALGELDISVEEG